MDKEKKIGVLEFRIQALKVALCQEEMKNNDLQKRIDKAIEYINKIKNRRKEGLTITEYKAKWRSLYDYLESDEIIADLLKFLKGDDTKVGE